MTDRQLTLRQSQDELDDIDVDEDLSDYLNELAPEIGWIVIYFNSLEDGVASCIRGVMLRDPDQDERMDVFLSEMLFAAKCRSLMHLYGQMIETTNVKVTQTDLLDVETMLLECSKRRNEYAHADWIGMKSRRYVRVKSQSKRQGIMHRYKRFDLERVQEDVEFINQARHSLDNFHERIFDQLWGRE